MNSAMKDNIISWGGNGLMYVMAAIQANEVLQWVQLGLSIAMTVFLLVYRIWRWYKEAKKDGKITEEELKEAIDIAQEGAEALKEDLDKAEHLIDKGEGGKDGDNH